MRTLHVGLRVSDLRRSLAFYQAAGYTVTGTTLASFLHVTVSLWKAT
jgi:catechol 2,3-dioxygenase-like lactoylglutathione lyase family enzyme